MPKITNDASNETPAPAVDPLGPAATHGYNFDGEQLQPKYVEKAMLKTELRAAAKRGTLAVAVVVEKIEECSSAGGTHIVFKVKDGLVHFGGHGTNLQLGPKSGETLIVAYEKLAAPENIEKSAWCVPAHTVFARATVVLGVASAADGERVIADLAK